MRLAAIYIRLRRRVDQRIELQSAQRGSHVFRFPEIKLRVIKPNDVEETGVFPYQGCTEPSASADDDEPLHWPLAKPEIPNPKPQIPNPKEISKTKHQWRHNTRSSCLKFGAWDFLGAWNLGFGISRPSGRVSSPSPVSRTPA